MSEPNGRSHGKLVSAATHLPPVKVDGSGWARKPGPRSQGKLVGAATHRPPVEVAFIPTPAAWLELVVSFAADTPPARVLEHTKRLVEAAARTVPDLRLSYDLGRSRSENDNVVIALIPRNPDGTAERLTDVADVIRQETGRLAAEPRVVVRIGKAA